MRYRRSVVTRRRHRDHANNLRTTVLNRIEQAFCAVKIFIVNLRTNVLEA